MKNDEKWGNKEQKEKKSDEKWRKAMNGKEKVGKIR